MKVLKKLNALKNYTVLAEIQLLTGAIPAVLFPILGFVAACIQVRYKEQYKLACLNPLIAEE